MSDELNVPAGIEDVNAEWLTAALRRNDELRSVTVSTFEVEPVGVGVGVMGLLYRLIPTYEGADGPAAIVMKMASRYEPVRQVARGYRFYEREVGVYRDLASALTLRTPRCYHAAHDPVSDDFVLVLEDLSSLRVCDQVAGCSVADALVVTSALARHHAQWFLNPRLLGYPFIQLGSDPPYPQFQAQASKADWPIFKERFGHSLPAPLLAIGERWTEVGPALMIETAKHPWTLAHGDVRLDNIFFDDAGVGGAATTTITIVDWQIAFRQPGAFDVAYFLCQSMAIEDRRAHEREILQRYHDELLANGVTDYPFDAFFDDFRRSVLFSFVYPMSAGANADLVNERVAELVRSMTARSGGGHRGSRRHQPGAELTIRVVPRGSNGDVSASQRRRGQGAVRIASRRPTGTNRDAVIGVAGRRDAPRTFARYH